MKAPRKRRTALAQAGGAVKSKGDPEVVAWLEAAAKVGGADARELTHGFHAWPARMHPLTARRAIRHAAPGWIVDPFMGGGTVAVEGFIAGRQTLGRDLNPVAVEVAWARTLRWGPSERTAFVDAAAAAATSARTHRPANKRVPRAFFQAEGAWYDPPALVDLWCLQRQIARIRSPPVARMLRVVLSSIAVKASRQATDSITRVDRDHRFVPKGRLLQWFVARAEEHSRNLGSVASAAPREAPAPTLRVSDGRAALELEPRSVGMICSSPPYPGTYDYVEHHRRRYSILDCDAGSAEALEIGSRREQHELGPGGAAARYAQDMARAFSAWRPSLAEGACVVLVVGDGQRKGGGVVQVIPLIERAAKDAGYRVLAQVAQHRSARGHTGGRKGASRHKAEFLLALTVDP